MRRIAHGATDVFTLLRTEQNYKRLARFFLRRHILFKELVDASIESSPRDFGRAITKNHHRQPLGSLYNLIEQRLQRLETRFIGVFLAADELREVGGNHRRIVRIPDLQRHVARMQILVESPHADSIAGMQLPA